MSKVRHSDQWIPKEVAAVAHSHENGVPVDKATDVRELVKADLALVAGSVRKLLSHNAEHPVFVTASSYFFGEKSGKRFRVMVNLLMAGATHRDASIVQTDVSRVLPTQRQLAEITEMLHVATLMHDDVIDDSDTRRGKHSANDLYGNKLAILAGDFLLSQVSVALARLNHCETVELMSATLGDLVQGEIIQMNPDSETVLDIEYYLRRTYLKTASLFANSCKSTVLLAAESDIVTATDVRAKADLAYTYGKNLGITYQVIDDILDFTAPSGVLAKPVLADLRTGTPTAPLLYALDQFPELEVLIKRKCSEPGDLETAYACIKDANGLDRARELAQRHTVDAINAATQLDASPSRDALIQLAESLLSRVH